MCNECKTRNERQNWIIRRPVRASPSHRQTAHGILVPVLPRTVPLWHPARTSMSAKSFCTVLQTEASTGNSRYLLSPSDLLPLKQPSPPPTRRSPAPRPLQPLPSVRLCCPRSGTLKAVFLRSRWLSSYVWTTFAAPTLLASFNCSGAALATRVVLDYEQEEAEAPPKDAGRAGAFDVDEAWK